MLQSGTNNVTVKARGRAISKAVDVGPNPHESARERYFCEGCYDRHRAGQEHGDRRDEQRQLHRNQSREVSATPITFERQRTEVVPVATKRVYGCSRSGSLGKRAASFMLPKFARPAVNRSIPKE